MNKIVAISSLGVVGALLLAVVLMAVIPINFNLKLQDKPDSIIIHASGYQQTIVSPSGSADERATYNKILELYNDMGSYSTLNSLFLGLWGKGIKAGVSDSRSATDLYSTDVYCVEFRYNTAKPMLDEKGKQFDWQENGPQTYTRIFIPVRSADAVNAVTYYVVNSAEVNPGVRLNYSAYANQSALHEYLSGLTYIV